MEQKFISDVSEVGVREEEDGKGELPAAFLSTLEGINTVSK
jgi:hypothetical protein